MSTESLKQSGPTALETVRPGITPTQPTARTHPQPDAQHLACRDAQPDAYPAQPNAQPATPATPAVPAVPAAGNQAQNPAFPSLPTFLPGRLVLRPGTYADYAALAPFHYRAAKPATLALIRAIDYHRPTRHAASTCPPDTRTAPRVVGVIVLSYPVPMLLARHRALGTLGQSYGRQLRFANAHVRTISRVIVHPAFRGIGLAGALVRAAVNACPSPYIEAVAEMARLHPFFTRAGLARTNADHPEEHPYFLAKTEPRDGATPATARADNHTTVCSSAHRNAEAQRPQRLGDRGDGEQIGNEQ